MIERRDSLIVVSANKLPGILKTIIKCGDSIWVNTQNVSYKINSKDSIHSEYLSDIVEDRWHNKWYGSLQEGLRKLRVNTGVGKTMDTAFWIKQILSDLFYPGMV